MVVYTFTYSCEVYIILLYISTSDQVFCAVAGEPNLVILLVVDFCELEPTRSHSKLSFPTTVFTAEELSLLLQNSVYEPTYGFGIYFGS